MGRTSTRAAWSPVSQVPWRLVARCGWLTFSRGHHPGGSGHDGVGRSVLGRALCASLDRCRPGPPAAGRGRVLRCPPAWLPPRAPTFRPPPGRQAWGATSTGSSIRDLIRVLATVKGLAGAGQHHRPVQDPADGHRKSDAGRHRGSGQPVRQPRRTADHADQPVNWPVRHERRAQHPDQYCHGCPIRRRFVRSRWRCRIS